MADSDNSAFNSRELTFLRKLGQLGERFMLVGLGAAVVQGADTMTQALDFWIENLGSPLIADAARAAGGFYSPRMQPTMVGGDGLERIDLVTHCDGLHSFAEEYENTVALDLDDFEIRVLRLDRMIASKTAAGLLKDRAVPEQLRTALMVIEPLK